MESGGGAMPSRELLAYLKGVGVSDDVVQALTKAMNHSDVDPYAQSYAHAMTQALDEYGESDGLRSIKVQVMYMLNNMGQWKGEEAREAKKILKKWMVK